MTDASGSLFDAPQGAAPLAELIRAITTFNAKVSRTDERIRLFQVPLERMI